MTEASTWTARAGHFTPFSWLESAFHLGFMDDENPSASIEVLFCLPPAWRAGSSCGGCRQGQGAMYLQDLCSVAGCEFRDKSAAPYRGAFATEAAFETGRSRSRSWAESLSRGAEGRAAMRGSLSAACSACCQSHSASTATHKTPCHCLQHAYTRLLAPREVLCLKVRCLTRSHLEQHTDISPVKSAC